MCARNKLSPSLPTSAILVLFLCIFTVAVHFVAEGQAVANSAAMDRISHTGQAQGHGEDHFTFFFSTDLSVEYTFHPGVSPLAIPAFSISLSPQLPPPNSQSHNG